MSTSKKAFSSILAYATVGATITALDYLQRHTEKREHPWMLTNAKELKVNMTLNPTVRKVEDSITDLVEKAGGIEAPKDAPTHFVIPAPYSLGGWFEVETVRDTTGLLTSMTFSRHICGFRGRREDSSEAGKIVFWRLGSRINCGIVPRWGESALTPKEFVARYPKAAKQFLGVMEYLTSQCWEVWKPETPPVVEVKEESEEG